MAVSHCSRGGLAPRYVRTRARRFSTRDERSDWPPNQVRGRRCLSRDSEARSLAEIRKRSTNHEAMNIARAHLDALKALGYTEAEARFLYLVVTHSGYFVARQFLAFANAHWGERTTTFWNKLHTKKHARTETFPKSGIVYHLFSRRLYPILRLVRQHKQSEPTAPRIVGVDDWAWKRRQRYGTL